MTEETEGLPVEGEVEDTLAESADETPELQTEDGNEEDGENEVVRPKKTAKDRIDELTRARREAERDRDYFREMALRTQPSQPQQSQAPVQQAPTRPDPNQYEAGEFDGRYLEDLAGWKAGQIVEQQLGQLAQQSMAVQAEAQWQTRVSKVAEKLPDFEEKVMAAGRRGEWPCSVYAAEAIRASDKGAEIAYHLATNPDEAARIYRLPPASQLMELGQIQASLTTPKSKTATNAPSPTPQVRGSGGKFATPADTNDFAAFDKQYGNGS